MDHHLNSTIPEPQPKRKRLFSIRLTEAEQNDIKELAKRLKLSSSLMARHFILQAVPYHRNIKQGDTSVEI